LFFSATILREKNRFVIFVGNYINMEIEIEKHPLKPFPPTKSKAADAGKFSATKKTVVDGFLLSEPEQ